MTLSHDECVYWSDPLSLHHLQSCPPWSHSIHRCQSELFKMPTWSLSSSGPFLLKLLSSAFKAFCVLDPVYHHLSASLPPQRILSHHLWAGLTLSFYLEIFEIEFFFFASRSLEISTCLALSRYLFNKWMFTSAATAQFSIPSSPVSHLPW